MASINVTKNRIDLAADELTNLVQRLEGKKESLIQCKRLLDSMWDGEANEKFNRAFEQDIVKINQFIDLLRRYIEVLKQVARNYQSVESRNLQIAGH